MDQAGVERTPASVIGGMQSTRHTLNAVVYIICIMRHMENGAARREKASLPGVPGGSFCVGASWCYCVLLPAALCGVGCADEER